MPQNLVKDIHIGALLKQAVEERKIDIKRICNFFKCRQEEIDAIYEQKNIDTEVLLKWSRLLRYYFFRVYSQHLILYAPSSSLKTDKSETKLPVFRKNIYTKEIIDFILEVLATGEKTKSQIIEEYKIPKTTLYKWIDKYTN